MTGLTFQIRLFTENGDLKLWIALPPGVSADQLTKEQWIEIFLYAPAQVIQRSDQRTPDFCEKLSSYVALLTQPQNPPFIDMGPTQ